MFEVVLDNATQNLSEMKALFVSYRIIHVKISLYHPESNSLVEVSYKTILATLSKLTNGSIKNVRDYIVVVVQVERTTVVSTTRLTPLEVIIGRDTILPIELKYRTYSILDQGKVRDRADLLALRARVLEEITRSIKEATLRQRRL